MKRLLPISLLLAALCISTAAFAQKDKVVEASSKRKPAWIGSSDRSHFAVTEVGETLAAASGKCMASIRQYIVNAVAVNVSSAEKMATRQITRDQLVTAMSDYSSALMTEAGQLPYLNDITLSNAEAVYWERIYSKKTKTYRYEYSVLYPFPEQTRRQLIEAFVAIDDAKQAEYDLLRRELGTITDIDRIRLAVNELDGLYDYFFDATRKGAVETLKRNYLALYNGLSVEVESETPGACVYSLRLGGRRAVTARQPRLQSESALEMNVKPYGDELYLLTYNSEYASPADVNKIDLTYLFGGARVSGLMDTLKIDEDTPIENRMITNTLESAQKKLEGRNFEIRKNVLKYDDVMNQQREIIYGQRHKVLNGEDISAEMHNMLKENIESSCKQFLAGDVKDEWDFGALRRHYLGWLTTDEDFHYTVADYDNISQESIADMLYQRGMDILNDKEQRYGAPLMRELERICLLKCVDRQWMDHIDNMDQLRQGIALRGYGQKDPVVEYRIEGFDMFDQMVDSIRESSIKMLLTIEVREAGAAPKREQVAKPTGEGYVPGNGAPGAKGAPKGQPVRVIKIGRNDPCPCGSGLKWKKCTCAKYHPEGSHTEG